MKALLRAGGAHDLNKATKAGTPLVCAAKHGHHDAALALVWAGADLNLADSRGWTPLMHTAYRGDAALADMLLLNGADSQIQDDRKCKPLVRALYWEHVDVIRVFLKSRSIRKKSVMDLTRALFTAASNGSTKSLRELIAAGANVTVYSRSHWHWGETPIHSAAQKGHAGAIHMLAAAGANVDRADGDDTTPLHNAAARHSVQCVKALLHWGADESLVNSDGQTPADCALDVHEEDEVFDGDALVAILHMLSRAPADRAWRRRGWIMMLCVRHRRHMRALAEQHAQLQQPCKRKNIAHELSNERNVHLVLKPFHGTVTKLIQLEVGVFRAIVSFL